VCSFDTKHFTSDGRFLYFLAPGWATSAALFRFDYYNKSVVFVTDANNVVVLTNCKYAEYKDHLLVLQHRYFVGGGSFDWYWLYKPGQFDRSSDPEHPYVFTNGSVDPVGPFERGADAAAHVCGGQ
jgi:hypothetical protein